MTPRASERARRSIIRRTGIALLSVALVAAGCGDDDDNGAASSRSDQIATSQGVSSDEILLGASLPLSGPSGAFGEQAVAGVESYLRLVNDRGGIVGRRLKLKYYDDQFDGAKIVANVRRLWEQDKVFAIIVLIGDSPLPYVNQKHIPYITFGASVRAFSSKFPTAMPMGASWLGYSVQTAIGITKYMNIHPKKVALMYDPTPIGNEAFVPEWTKVWQKLGATTVVADPVGPETTDCSSLILKYRDMGIEYWDFGSFFWPSCVLAEARVGWKPTLGQGGSVAGPVNIARVVGPLADGLITGSPNDLPTGKPSSDTPTPQMTEYIEATKKYFPNVATDDIVASTIMPSYWISTRFLVDAIVKAADGGKLTQDGVLDVMGKTKNYETGMSRPIIQMKPTCKQGSGSAWWGVWKVEGETFTKVPKTPMVGIESLYPDPCIETKLADSLVG